MLEDKRQFIYRIDSADRIVFANADWYDFASENGDTRLLPENVIGQSIWKFICNSETKNVYELLLKKVSETGAPINIHYRCDSPDRRRFMELRMRRAPQDEIEFCSRILREEFRESVPLMDDAIDRTAELLIMCGWCKKVDLGNGRWVEVEAAVNEKNLFNASRLPEISHGMCVECHETFIRKLNQENS